AAVMTSLRMPPTASLVLLLFVSGAAAQNGWGVTYNPTSICAVKGSTVNMSCTYTHPSGHSVKKAFWSKQLPIQKGVEPPDLLDDPDYRGRVQYLGDKQHNTTLRLQNVTEKDQTIYYFRFLTNKDDGKWTGAGGVDLKVTGLQVEVPERVMEGGNVTLTCNTTCSLTVRPTFTWYRGGGRLSSSTDQLLLQPVSREHAGRYHCSAQDQNSTEVTLNVTYGPKNLSVSISPSGEIVESSSVTLTCSSDANPPVDCTWFNGTSLVVKGKTYTLKVSSVDSGVYRCRCSNGYIEKYSAAVSLNVLYPPRNICLSVSPSDEIVGGSSVTLTCRSNANPPVQNYTWFKVGGDSPVGSGHSYSPLQSGSYYCVAQNKYGSQKSAGVTVSVKGAGVQNGWGVTYNPTSICAVKGSTVNMSCTYKHPGGHSVKKAYWSKELPVTTGVDPPDLLDGPDYRGRVQYLGDKQHNTTLRLQNVTEKDQIKYYFRFITHNPNGKWSGEGGIDLKVTGLQVEVPERVMEGGNVTLTCNTTCSLTVRPTFTWYRGGRRLSSSTDQLHLQPVSREDAGRYHCSAQDQNSTEVTLNVTYGPKSVSVSISPPGYIVEGSSVTLTCSSDGNPPVNYTWYEEGGDSPVGSGQSYSALENGSYYCVAQNEYGSQKSAAVTVKGITDGPKNISVSISPSGEIVEGSSVTLTCSSDADPPVDCTWFKGTSSVVNITAAVMTSLRMPPTASLVLLLFVSGAAAQNGWGVTYNPTSICAVKGSTVTMSCTYTHPSGYSVKKAFWTKQLPIQNGVEPPDLLDNADYRGRVQYLGDKQHNTTLSLQNVTEKDQTIYYFRFLTNKDDGKWTGKGGVDLKVTGLQVEVPERVMEGRNITLTCNTTCSLTVRPTFTWYRGGHRLSSSTDQLHLQPVSREDAGRYHCSAQDQNSTEVTLNVTYGPKNISASISPSGEIVEGSSVTLTCSSDADPPVNCTWFKGTSLLVRGETYTLKVSSVDSGGYRCRCSNGYIEKYSEAVSLNVLYPPRNISLSVSASDEILGGSSFTLTCHSDANPPVQNYTWFKDGGDSPVGSGHSYSPLQSGSYYCVAQNEYGSQKSAGVTVSVKVSIRIHIQENIYSNMTVTATTSDTSPLDPDPSNQDDALYASVVPRTANNPRNARGTDGEVWSASIQHRHDDMVEMSEGDGAQYASVRFTLHSCPIDGDGPLISFKSFDDDIGAVSGCTVVGIQGVQEMAEHTALWGSSVKGVCVSLECGGDGIVCRRVGTIRKLQWVQRRGELAFNVLHDKPLEALHDDRSECSGTVVVEAAHRGLLWDRDDGGGFEACWDDCSAQRDVQDVHFTHILYMIIQAALLIPLTMTLTVHLLFLLFSSGAGAQNDWGVTYKPTSICAVKGSTVTMSCTYKYPSDHSVMKAYWTKQWPVTTGVDPPDLLNDPDYRGRVQYLGDQQHNDTLRLQNVTEKDQIKYYFKFITNKPDGKWTGKGGVDLKVTGLQVEVPERVMEGGTITLTCNTTCSLTVTPTFTWYRGEHGLSSSTDQLHLQPVSREDAGRYRCAVLDQNLHSPEVTLNVRYGPKSVSVSISPSDEIVGGSSVTLTCSSDGNPPVDYTWYKEGGDSPVGSGHSYSALQSGSYYCVAQNEYGSQKSAAVTVTVKAERSMCLSVERSMVLYVVAAVGLCGDVVLIGVVLLMWKRKKRATEEHDYQNPDPNAMDDTYTALDPRSRSSDDVYNTLTAALLIPLTMTLTVHLLFLLFSSGAGSQKDWGVTYNPTAICAVKGSTVNMSCTYKYPHGHSVTKTFWTKTWPVNGGEPPDLSVDPDYRGRVQYLGDKQHIATLRLQNVTEKDQIKYYFRFLTVNADGKWTGADGVDLNVTGLQVEVPKRVMEGGNVTLTCNTTCRLTVVPTFTWYRGGRRLSSSTDQLLHLQPVRREDAGRYRCAVLDQNSPEVTLNVSYGPKNVSVSISPPGYIVEGSSVNLTCSSDANPPVQNYTWFKEGGDSPVGSGHSYSALQSGSYYCVAQNEYGSQKSAAVTVKGNTVLYAVIGVGVGVGCVSVIIAVVCLRKKRRETSADDANQTQISRLLVVIKLYASLGDVVSRVHHFPLQENLYSSVTKRSTTGGATPDPDPSNQDDVCYASVKHHKVNNPGNAESSAGTASTLNTNDDVQYASVCFTHTGATNR
ncbi:hypothetical protein NFI96_028489, partial [Prochilodus magdalenae]